MAKYALIIDSNRRYTPGLNALLNSLDRIGNEHDVWVCSYRLPTGYKEAIDAAGFTYRVEWREAPDQLILKWGEGDVMMRYRYSMPSKMCRYGCSPRRDRDEMVCEYDAVCVLDADMWVEEDLTPWLDIAAQTDYVFGCGHEQHRKYDDPNHSYPNGQGWIIETDHMWFNDLCSVPLIAGKRWYPSLLKSWEMYAQDQSTRIRSNDMDALNIALISDGAHPSMMPLPQQLWTGLHECMLKAHTRARMHEGRVCTEDGQRIKLVHGQYWNLTWRGDQVGNQSRMIDREFNGSASYHSRSEASMQFLVDRFMHHSVRHKVNIEDFMEQIQPGIKSILESV